MEASEIIAKAIDLSDKSLQDIVQALQVELQDREIRMRIDPEFTNEEVFEDALTHGLTPEDASNPDWALKYEEWLSQRDRKMSMRTTGA